MREEGARAHVLCEARSGVLDACGQGKGARARAHAICITDLNLCSIMRGGIVQAKACMRAEAHAWAAWGASRCAGRAHRSWESRASTACMCSKCQRCALQSADVAECSEVSDHSAQTPSGRHR